MSKLPRTIPPVDEWGWIGVALGLACFAEIGLRTVGLPRLSGFLGTPIQSDDETTTETVAVPTGLAPQDRRRVRATRRVMRHWPFGDTCLRQALVGGALLRHRSPSLVVGVAKLEGKLRAHAWLEIDGGILDPLGAASSYTRLTALPTGKAS